MSEPTQSILSPESERWPEFYDLLVEACEFTGEGADATWLCGRDGDRLARARELLTTMGAHVEGSLALFQERRAHCDCEVVFNLAPDDDDEDDG